MSRRPVPEHPRPPTTTHSLSSACLSTSRSVTLDTFQRSSVIIPTSGEAPSSRQRRQRPSVHAASNPLLPGSHPRPPLNVRIHPLSEVSMLRSALPCWLWTAALTTPLPCPRSFRQRAWPSPSPHLSILSRRLRSTLLVCARTPLPLLLLRLDRRRPRPLRSPLSRPLPASPRANTSQPTLLTLLIHPSSRRRRNLCSAGSGSSAGEARTLLRPCQAVPQSS